MFLRTKVEKELGLSPDAGGAALGDAFVVGATYLGAAIVPLWPDSFFFPVNVALVISLACTLLALFFVGVAKGRVTRLSLLRSGLQVMIVELDQRRRRIRNRAPRHDPLRIANQRRQARRSSKI